MSKSDGTFYRSKTFHVVERVRARVPLEIYWRPPEEAFPPVKNHWCSNTRLHSFKISAGLRCFIWTILPKQHALRQGRTEVRWPPGQDTSLAPPCSNLRSFGSNVLYWRKYLWHCWVFSAPGALCPLAPSRYAPALRCWIRSWYLNKTSSFRLCWKMIPLPVPCYPRFPPTPLSVGRIFSRERPIVDFSRGATVVKFHFTNSETKRKPFL